MPEIIYLNRLRKKISYPVLIGKNLIPDLVNLIFNYFHTAYEEIDPLVLEIKDDSKPYTPPAYLSED